MNLWLIKLKFKRIIEDDEIIFSELNQLGAFNFSLEYSLQEVNYSYLSIWLSRANFSKKNCDSIIEKLSSSLTKKPLEASIQNIVEEDWLLGWKSFWEPDPVGDKLLILPAWLGPPKQYLNRSIIKIDPGSAFGTGKHPSTRLCLEALHEISLKEKIVGDLGCGSGILSLAALKLGAKSAYAFDIDSLAINSANINASLNQEVAEQINIYLGSVESMKEKLAGEKIDLLLCNILANVIKDLSFAFVELLNKEGELFLSGILNSQVNEIKAHFKSLGWVDIGIYHLGEWALIRLSREKDL